MKLKGKKVLVTGACGFIGSHLVERLSEEGCSIRAFTFYNSRNSWGWLETIAPSKVKKIEIFSGDIRDPNGVKTAVRGTDIVFHLAALIGIPFSYHFPDSYVDTNIKGALNVLHACKNYGVEKVIITSSSEVYGTAKYVPIDESHPLCGQSPYSATKIGADKIAESFYYSFGTPVVIVRPFNTFGPRQSARAIIPAIIIQLLNGKKKISLGSLAPTRDFNYVKDVCDAFISIANSDKSIGETINIATESEVSMGELADRLIKKINPKATVVLDRRRVRPEDSEVAMLKGSNKKITMLTKWKPRYSFDEGLDETIAWFRNKENLKLYKADIYNV